MEARVQELEEQVGELADEVRILRSELRRLRRRLEGDSDTQSLRSPGPARSERSEAEGSEAYSVVSRQPSSYGAAGGTATPLLRSPSTPSSTAARTGARCVLTWAQREAICDQIALFVVRALAGQQHGSSGRDQINLASRVWLVFRDYDGNSFNPVRVYRLFGRCSSLVKKGPHDLGQSVFVGLPSDREARRVVAIAGLEWPADES